jgi:hypothetical protein
MVIAALSLLWRCQHDALLCPCEAHLTDRSGGTFPLTRISLEQTLGYGEVGFRCALETSTFIWRITGCSSVLSP